MDKSIGLPAAFDLFVKALFPEIEKLNQAAFTELFGNKIKANTMNKYSENIEFAENLFRQYLIAGNSICSTRFAEHDF